MSPFLSKLFFTLEATPTCASPDFRIVPTERNSESLETWVDWDTAIALAYAAEQLFIAAQALTSDLVSTGHGLSVADARINALLQNSEFLPAAISQRVRKLHDCYLRRRAVAHQDASIARSLANDTMLALAEIRDVLSGMEQRNRLVA
jgi:hypothetical protein